MQLSQREVISVNWPLYYGLYSETLSDLSAGWVCLCGQHVVLDGLPVGEGAAALEGRQDRQLSFLPLTHKPRIRVFILYNTLIKGNSRKVFGDFVSAVCVQRDI